METSAEPGFEMAKAIVLSPSQIKVYQEGRRKWAWQYLAKAPRKSSASADLGNAVHWQCERHLRGEGFDYSTPTKKKSAEIAILGVHLLPPPNSPGMRVENRLVGAPPGDASDKDFRFETRDGIVYRGRMDVTVPDSSVVPGLWGGAPAVIDHKTSSNIAAYSLSEEHLHTDTQAVIYAYYLMSLYCSPVADLQWNYLPTRGPKVAQPRRLRVFSPRVVDEFHRIHAQGSEMSVIYSQRPHPLELPPCSDKAGSGEQGDPCEAYGGCPFKALCTDVFSPLGFPIPKKETITMTTIHMPTMPGTTNGTLTTTAQGQALMNHLTAAAPLAPSAPPATPPDPYIAYAAWRASVPAAPLDPAYGPLEARYQASLAPPPPVVEALPAWATAAVDPLTARAAPAPVVLPAINPPEFQLAPTLEERAAVLTTTPTPAPAAEPKKTRTRRTNEQIAADKAKGPGEFTIFVLDVDGTYTQETVSARAVFVR